ncbi:hypothetical protein [Haloarchaeobius salinus]|uniref:hypothetical protein n=1 Tax=Haloarchaeobius salinus TaxID=1198298 RepID=UPI0021096C3A|nr:hypothetical protein [Haloarchaeobius salinus]
MADRPNWSRPQRADERTTATRRRFLGGGVAAAALSLAGCLDDTLAGAHTDDDETENTEQTTTNPTDSLRNVIGEYIDAAAAGDMDALAAVTHGESLLHPDQWSDTDWEFDTELYRAVDDFELQQVTRDVSIEFLLEFHAVDVWFDEEQLGTRIGPADIAVVDLGSDPLTEAERDSWILVTEDGEWRVFFVGDGRRATEDPRASFEPEILDTEGDVVDTVTWDVEPGSTAGEAAAGRIRVRVALTDSPGVDADTVRIETTVADTELEFYTEKDGAITTSWAGNTGTIGANATGDQLVVTAVDGETETVVHREHYEPGNDDDA